MNEREMKLLAVQQAGFTMYDTLLYLDTHPSCTDALEHFNEAKEEYERAKRDYESKYGALVIASAGNLSEWDWNQNPMPWEVC